MSKTYEVAASLRSTVTRLTRQLRKQNISSAFSNAELLTMGLLDQHGSMLPSALADLERISAQAISQIINRLVEAGVVDRASDESDKRKVLITLTPAGKQHLDENRRIKEEWLVKAMDNLFSTEELALIEAFLPLLQRLAEYNG
ncbi:MarR family winged helix-turn-helix transcriptional regulator [Chitinophaga sancti]|uniref:DNA-binding transcriptional regulator, MarR family n=1 Tax=Chitinophaga sancti TaxID=1004 RepID=A0A1K1PG81_9BACT|nr:MarR family transcriptional regulator [Chitinophaga sancti]WQD65881.1 MarR family transcriptional regulator [Chitinophaga sancti]WQG88497.1 MarR family transcriptional regulator [Chitinophaga sancti]SFW46607.1 DNA-binding transcriptional regulator, MarR family [Chitinophaga sancti]